MGKLGAFQHSLTRKWCSVHEWLLVANGIHPASDGTEVTFFLLLFFKYICVYMYVCMYKGG